MSVENAKYVMTSIASKIKVGDRVEVAPGGRRGEVKYVGKAEVLGAGYWVGVEYDEPVGKNDGSVKGRRCVECALDYGGFVRPDKVHPDNHPPSKAKGGGGGGLGGGGGARGGADPSLQSDATGTGGAGAGQPAAGV